MKTSAWHSIKDGVSRQHVVQHGQRHSHEGEPTRRHGRKAQVRRMQDPQLEASSVNLHRPGPGPCRPRSGRSRTVDWVN